MIALFLFLFPAAAAGAGSYLAGRHSLRIFMRVTR